MRPRRLILGFALLVVDLGAWVPLRLADPLAPGRAWILERGPVLHAAAFVLLVLAVSLLASGRVHRAAAPILAAPGGSVVRGIRRGVVVLWFAVGIVLIALAGLLQMASFADAWRYRPQTVLRLPDPGPYEEAVLLSARGHWSTTLYVRRPGEALRRVDGDAYAACSRPRALRSTGNGPRYAIVGADGWVGAWIDLEAGTIADRPSGMPPLEDLRRDFGDDLKGRGGPDVEYSD